MFRDRKEFQKAELAFVQLFCCTLYGIFSESFKGNGNQSAQYFSACILACHCFFMPAIFAMTS